MRTSDHREITRIIFGREHEDIHIWLDETFSKWVNSNQSLFNHWIARHHRQAINEKYVDEEKRAVAYLHVICDISSRWGEFFLPLNDKALKNFLVGRNIVIV